MNEHFATCTVTSLHKLALFLIVLVTALWIDVSRTCLFMVFKTINNYPPEYLRDLFRLRDNIKNLRGVNKYRKLIERERKRERPLFIHIRVVHSDALATAINWGPNKD